MLAEVVIPEKDLPDWMKRARRGFDWGVLLIIGFSILIAWPLIENPNLPQSNDSIHYAFQAYDTAQALQEGRLYPRWSPQALGGLGAPVPHYKPPLPAYVTALMQILFTSNAVVALRVIHILSLIFAGLALYTLVMQRVDGLAGLLAALLYVYSPYLSFTVPHILGDLTQAIALALLPMLLWSVNRLIYRNQAADILLVAIMSALLFLTSPLHTILGICFAASLLILYSIENRSWTAFTPTVIALGIGLGMAAFYWLPAYFERNLVDWLPVSQYIRPETLSFQDLFSNTTQPDRGALLHTPVFNLGWSLLAFIVLSMILAIFRKGTRFQMTFLLMGVVLLIGTIMLVPGETWLMGGSVLCMAIGTSNIGQQIIRQRPIFRYPLIVGTLMLIFGFSLPIWVSQTSLASIRSVSEAAQLKYETQAGTIALLPPDALFPTTLPPEIIRNRIRFADEFDINTNRFRAETSLPTLSESGTHYARYNVFTNTPTTLIYEQTYFVGWRAIMDKLQIPLSADATSHLTHIELPAANNGSLTVFLGATPIRTIAWLLSYLMLGSGIFWVRRRWQNHSGTVDMGQLIPGGEVRLLIILLVIGIAARTTPFLRDTIYMLRQPIGYQLANRTFTTNRTQSNLEFQGYEIGQSPLIAGDEVEVILYWQAFREGTQQYLVSIQLYDPTADTVLYESNKHPPAYYPTTLWALNSYVADTHMLPTPADIPTGSYMIRVQLWRCTATCNEPVSFFRPDRQLLGDAIAIPITIIQQ